MSVYRCKLLDRYAALPVSGLFRLVVTVSTPPIADKPEEADLFTSEVSSW
jgi:hypothetical protein